MAQLIAPPPIPQEPIGENRLWRDWFQNLRAWVVGGATGTFKTSDTPSKTVTVKDGIIVSIQ